MQLYQKVPKLCFQSQFSLSKTKDFSFIKEYQFMRISLLRTFNFLKLCQIFVDSALCLSQNTTSFHRVCSILAKILTHFGRLSYDRAKARCFLTEVSTYFSEYFCPINGWMIPCASPKGNHSRCNNKMGDNKIQIISGPQWNTIMPYFVNTQIT